MRDEEGNQFILCFWRAADRSYVRAADFLLLWIMHAEKGRGNDRSGERCADFKWPDKRPSEARRCTETDGKVLEFRRIFTHIRIKLILVFVSRDVTQTQNDPLTLRRNDLYLWVNMHMSQTLLFLHSGERFCTSMCLFLQDLWWKHQYFSIEIKLPYLCGYEPCVAAAPSFHFTADCSHCFFKLHTAPRDKLVCLKYSEGCLPEKSTSSVKKT